MYVMIVARGCPSAKHKLFGISEFNQAKALAAAGHKVVYAAVDIRSVRRWRRWGISVRNSDGVIVYTISIPVENFPAATKSRITISALRILYNRILKDKGKPDLMHAHFADMANAAASLKTEIGLPLVVTEHTAAVLKQDIDLTVYDKAVYAYSKSDILIAVSPSLRQAIKAKFGIDAIYIPDMVDSDLFCYEERSIPKDRIFRFVSVGNLVQSTRMDLLINAYAQIFAGNPNVSLNIFGDGPDRDALANAISGMGLQDSIKLMGQQSREDTAASLKDCDCFVLAYQPENFGLAFVEALFCGVPVIASRSGGPEVFVNSGNGLLVPVNDLDRLAAAMDFMYKNSNNYNHKKISDDALVQFSPEYVAARLTDVYTRIASASMTHSAYGRREY
ncbi:MAG: glycosyltransferase [Saccharofermentanales bacterium]